VNRHPTSETVFLVSGGAKGITAQCVVKLAERYGARFILVGRSSYEAAPEPAWAVAVADEVGLKRAAMEALTAAGERPTPRRVQQMVRHVLSQREISATLRAVAAAGGEAVYVAADVTDAAALQRAAAKGAAQIGPIKGVIHGAGLVADKLIHQKAVEDFDRVVAVKVEGLNNLLACAPPEQLDYLVLFSSVAGFYGNVGQVDYAIANEILNKTAHQVRVRHPHCRVVAVDWGPWDGGMVSPALKAQLADRGIQVIPVDEGTEILVDLLAEKRAPGSQPAQVVVGSPMPAPSRGQPDGERTYRVRRRLTLEANPFLGDHVIGGYPVLPTVCAAGWMIGTCEQLYPGYRFAKIWDYRALKGIVFDESLAEMYVMDVKARPAEDVEDGIAFDTLIWSETSSGLPRYHYSAQVVLRRELPARPDAVAVTMAAPDHLDGATFYRDGTLFHGPSFQGIQEVLRIDEEGLTMRCRLPALSWETQGQFAVNSFNPYLTDVQLQSLLVWSKRTFGYGGLPLRIQGAIQYRTTRFGEETFASMQVQASTPRSLVADVIVHDKAGVPYMKVLGAEITLSERMNALFEQNRVSGGVAHG
jgi:NAD(P)-dependent dehydrogenase (short-subunit alcohol dehydrogenase family)